MSEHTNKGELYPYDFPTDRVIDAMQDSEYAKEQVRRKLHLMTSNERMSLYRAVHSLIAAKSSPAPAGEQALPERPPQGPSIYRESGYVEATQWNKPGDHPDVLPAFRNGHNGLSLEEHPSSGQVEVFAHVARFKNAVGEDGMFAVQEVHPGNWICKSLDRGNTFVLSDETFKTRYEPEDRTDAQLRLTLAQLAHAQAESGGLRDVLREMAWNHGSLHEDDCPQDDTCECKWKGFNERVNAACGAIESAELTFMSRANRAEAEAAALRDQVAQLQAEADLRVEQAYAADLELIQSVGVVQKTERVRGKFSVWYENERAEKAEARIAEMEAQG